MNRREFLLLPFLYLQESMESQVRTKVHESRRLNLETLLKIKEIKSLKENDFSIVYSLFEDVSDTKIGTASINFYSKTKTMDLGVDDFTFIADIYLSIASIFSKKYKSVLDLEDLRYFLEFDEKFIWKKYRENIPIRDNPESNPHEYELNKKKVILDSKNFASGKKLIHNPLSAAFEILNGNKLTNFEMVANAKYSNNVKINYEGLNGFVIISAEFGVDLIKSFKKVYAISYNNIPLSGYIMQDGEGINYVRGELENIIVNGKKLF